METTAIASEPATGRHGVHARVLGEAWTNLHPALRRLHAGTAPVYAHGRFRVRHGDRPPARLFVRLLRLPREGDGREIRLLIRPSECGEIWERQFEDGVSVVSRVTGADGHLAELFGPLEVRFRLVVTGPALRYRSTGAALRLAGLRIPLGQGIGPRIVAREWGSDHGQLNVRVRCALPGTGLLIAYGGPLTIEEGP